ncbi:MAG: hypothetical protein LRY71_19155 [Bacillaceae bacterium]|nr:hypothetical protein [Bacillaceae bacterium]
MRPRKATEKLTLKVESHFSETLKEFQETYKKWYELPVSERECHELGFRLDDLTCEFHFLLQSAEILETKTPNDLKNKRVKI